MRHFQALQATVNLKCKR